MTVSGTPTTALSAHLTTCSSSLVGLKTQLVPEVSGCFQSMGQPDFAFTSAWSCIAIAPIYCSSTTVCTPTSTSTPLIPPLDSSFEKAGAASSGWTQMVAPTMPNMITFSFSTEQARTGSYSLKIHSNNAAADTTTWGHPVGFEPGKTYEFAFWYYAPTSQPPGTLSFKSWSPGSSLTLVMGPQNMPVGQWKQQKYTVTPSTTFGWVSIIYASAKGTGTNVIYIDDITVTAR